MFGGVLQEGRFPDTRLPADDQSGAAREPCCVHKVSQGGTVRLPAVQHPNNFISATIAPFAKSTRRGIARRLMPQPAGNALWTSQMRR